MLVRIQKSYQGVSLIEVILSMAIFGLIAAAMVTLAVGGFTALGQGGEQTEAEALAQEGLEAVRAIRDGAWNELLYTTSSVSVVSSSWSFDGELTTETIGQYTRTISFEDVCRDSSGDITDCPGSYTDIHTKQATVSVLWEVRPGVTNEVQKITYFTNWDSRDWVQTDWVGGSGQSIWSDETMYDSDNGNIEYGVAGQVTLLEQAGSCGSKLWPFTASSSYTYDNTKIEIASGVAQLVSSPGSTVTGTTQNNDFVTDAASWSFTTWDAGGGEVTPTGDWQSIGGNPSGYIDVDIPSNAKNDEVGGFWEQSISVTENSATVTCSFDWSVVDWVAANGVDDYQVYVFLDSASGEPTIGNQVWSSGSQSGTSAWSGTQNIDCSSAASTAGTYYFKLAVWLDAKNKNTGPVTVGFDNALVYWEKSGGGSSYPADVPSIYPNNSHLVSSIDAWSGFNETATKNGGEIYYQLSDDNGSTWQYWNGSVWITAGASNYNTASIVNTNIGTFATSTGQINFKAFLESDGTQLVQLDQVDISCAKQYDFTFDVPGDYVYNSSNIVVTSSVAELVYTPSGGSCSGTPAACDTFGDETLCTGQTSCSWGGGGAGYCSNVGSCSAEPPGQCSSSCGGAGCSKSKGQCQGTLDCSAYTTEGNCGGCGQCLWVPGGASCSGTPDACNTFGSQTPCTNQSGCSWGGGGGGYDDSVPSIYPSTSLSVSTTSLNVWESLIETATKNTGEIYYQLSDDNGSTWQYWNGSAWITAGASNYNTASIVNTNITSFSTTTGQISFKAFLESDGSVQVSLDNVRITWSEGSGVGGGGGFATSAYLISSVFDMADISPVQVISWTEDVSSCDPNCDIQTQLRTAPDNGGSPGVWTNWYGATGSGTYFIDPFGTLVSLDLNDDQWVQYRVELIGDGTNTPILQDITVNYK